MNPNTQTLKQRSDQLERSRKNLEKAEVEYRKAQKLIIQSIVETVTFIGSKIGK
jgi:hypothetical protein